MCCSFRWPSGERLKDGGLHAGSGGFGLDEGQVLGVDGDVVTPAGGVVVELDVDVVHKAIRIAIR